MRQEQEVLRHHQSPPREQSPVAALKSFGSHTQECMHANVHTRSNMHSTTHKHVSDDIGLGLPALHQIPNAENRQKVKYFSRSLLSFI